MLVAAGGFNNSATGIITDLVTVNLFDIYINEGSMCWITVPARGAGLKEQTLRILRIS